MTQHAAPRCSRGGWLAGSVGPLLRCAAFLLLEACGPREPPPEIPPPAAQAEAPVTSPAPRADTSNGVTAAESIPNATVTATIQGDPFAAVDVTADERLRQILRVSDKARPPAGKAQAPVAPPAPNPVPAPPAEPARQAPLAAAPAPAPVVQEAPPPQSPLPSAESAVPATAVAAPTVPAEPPRPPLLRAIERSQPPFPVEAQRQGVLSGRVIAAITVLPDGTVGQVDIVESTPQRIFDRAVRNTLLRWRFEPVPQQVRANVEIVFNAE